MSNKLLVKIVTEAYETHAASGSEFTLADVIDAAMCDAALDALSAEVLAEAVTGVAKRIDKTRTARTDESLFGDSGQVVPLGEGRRRRRGSLTLGQLQEHLSIVAENERNVRAAAKREHDEVERLRPFFTSPSTTRDQALARWEKAQAKGKRP